VRHGFIVLALFVAGCQEPPSQPPATPRPELERGGQRHAPVTLAPLGGEPLEHVVLEGRIEAWIGRPVGATTPRPIVVGVHGAGDKAEWSCAEWRATTRGEAWVVCPVGVPSKWPGVEAWGSAEQIASRADAGVTFVREQFGPYVANGPMIYGGFSQGATLASSAIASRPGQYGTAILVEAGYTPLDENAVMRDLVAGRVTRLVVSCSSMQCRGLSARLERVRTKAVTMWTNDVGLRGHYFDQPVSDSLGKVMREVDSASAEPKVAAQ
jgi:hypothetical protein